MLTSRLFDDRRAPGASLTIDSSRPILPKPAGGLTMKVEREDDAISRLPNAQQVRDELAESLAKVSLLRRLLRLVEGVRENSQDLTHKPAEGTRSPK